MSHSKSYAVRSERVGHRSAVEHLREVYRKLIQFEQIQPKQNERQEIVSVPPLPEEEST
jgi:hypothetical protein